MAGWRSVKAGELVDQACEGVPGPARAGEPIHLENTCHGTRNGHFAPFAWAA